MNPGLDEKCSRYYCYRDLVECGETWRQLRIENLPIEFATYESIARLCLVVLDPVRDTFGPIELTYGFAGRALSRAIRARIAPALDQHAGHELDRRGAPICRRLGQAADFRVPGRDSSEVARWIVENTAFDRLYIYGGDRPLHVSVGPDEARSVVEMRAGPSGRLLPRRKRVWP